MPAAIHVPEATVVRVGVRDLRRDLSAWLRRAAAGERIEVMSRDKPIAELGPAVPTAGRRGGRGALKGKIWMADNFDEWDEEELASFERWP